MSKLEDGIENLKTISDKFLVKRKHFFISEFDTILRFLFASTEDCLQVIHTAAPFSSISTFKLTKFLANNYSSPSILDQLWPVVDGKVISYTDSLFDSS